VITCPNCGTENPPTNRFCGACGTPLDPNGRVARTERRMVTVLFADLVGFTPLTAARDPEEVREMLSVYFERSQEIVERFRGTVEKFIGDAVMAWWGAVEAREDDAERAVRAALELVDMVSTLGSELGLPDLALRAGVLTGEAAVGNGAGNQGVVVGDMVNTASRLQSIAEPGTVVVGESTRNLVAEAIEFRSLGEHQVKGKDQPIAAYQALCVIAQRGGRGRAEGIEPPFTGRVEEMRLIKDQLHATGREQRGRLVSIVGDPGIGKSRLSWELQKYIDGIADPIYWHQGRSPSYGEGIAFWSVGEMVRSRAGIAADSDDKTKSRVKLRTAVAEYVPSEEERSWVEPRLAALIGLDEMPPGDRNELFAALRTFFYRVAERGTVVMLFDEFQRADVAVHEFITELVDRANRHPVLVITLARTDLLERFPSWGSGRRNTVAVHLAPLTDGEMGRLIAGMVPGIPDHAVEAIAERAAGIPLYAVEFVRMLLATGDLVREGDAYLLKGDLSRLAVPDSLAAVIGARLDRLNPADRELVQDAAVLGQAFTLKGLAVLRGVTPLELETPLRALVQKELFFIDEDPLSADRGRYRFVQSLIREVAYGRLSRGDRHVRHRQVAEYFAGLDDPEIAGRVARHFLAAHETAPAGTEDLLEKGRAALIRAANRASELRSHSQALALYRQALSLAKSTAERAPILIKASAAASWGGDLEEAIELGREAITVMEELGDSNGCYQACTTLAFVLNSYFRSDEAVELLEPLYSEIDQFDTAAKVSLGLEMSRAHMLHQMPDKAIEVADRVLPHAERLVTPGALVDGIVSKATALADVGRYLEAEATLAGAARLAEQHGLHPQALRALNNLSVIQASNDPQAAQRTADAHWELTQKYGGLGWLERARTDRAWQLPAMGRFDEALEILDAIEVEHLPPFQQGAVRSTRHYIEGMLSPKPGHGRHLLDGLSSWGEITDPQAIITIKASQALGYRDEGDWDNVWQTSYGVPVTWAVVAALGAAMRMKDAERVRLALAALDAELPPGRYAKGLRQIGNAALTILEGGAETGAAAFAEGLDLLAKLVLPMELADWQTVFATLTGFDQPAALEAATAAQEWISSVGAHGLERMWSDGLPRNPMVERAG
jgi:class 3 adenylate cyclase/tetratricopeptide (TPR) repeat protein